MSASQINLRVHLLAALVAVFAMTGCGSEGGTSGTGDDDTDMDSGEVDTGPDTAPDIGTIDADGDTGTVDVGPELADIGEPCEIADDCESAYCVDVIVGEGGGVCSQRCFDGDDCPPDFDCVFISTSEGDAEQVCLPLDLCFDADMDGYGVGPGCLGTDCDDNEPLANPVQNELCDGIDNDCDGATDDFPIDAGEDCNTGFEGLCAMGRTECSGGFLSCEGLDPVDEECDGLDNDCDGMVDEGLADTVFYPDADADGFGDPDGVTVMDCDRPVGYVENRSDCNDMDDASFPGAPEMPGDGIDSDCNGTELCYADRDNDDVRTDEIVVSADLTCMGMGVADNTVPGIDCNDNDASVGPGGMEIPGNGSDDDCDGTELCYIDADGDGVATNMTVMSSDLACDGMAEADDMAPRDDCLDTEPAVFPGNPEICDMLDNDCNMRVDDGAGCYPIGDPCVDDVDCASGVCLDGLCADPRGCNLPGSCPDRVGFPAGGETTSSPRFSMDITLGSPLSVQNTTSDNYRISIGLGVYRTDP